MTGLVSRSRRLATPAEERFDPHPATNADDECQSDSENANASLATFGAGVVEEQEVAD
jgi:hypothetical protein